jgi:NADH-quinone oxidoreductase subunit N
MNYAAVLPEIFTSILGILVIALGLIIPKDKKVYIGYFTVLGLVAILAYSFLTSSSNIAYFSNGNYAKDALSIYFKQIFLISAILVTIISISFVKKLTDSKSEFFAVTVFALLGAMVMSSANDFITLYIGLELMTISFIILTAFDKKSIKSTEAGIKYVLLSAISSAVLLYGISLLYGLSGSVSFDGILAYMKKGYSEPMAILSGILLIAGLGFKISAVPFHMWSPDIYEGAPAPITAFLAVGSKAAGFAVLVRVFTQAMAPTFSSFWIIILTLSILSMVIGNLIALPQTSIKRMLAFSSISQAGYILLGIVAHTSTGLGAMLYYLLLYVFANTGAFAAITAFSNQTGEEEIKDFGGMWKRSPFLAATLLISLLSMAGIPPAAGFIGKFYLFSEIVKQGNIWIVLLAVSMSVVSVYYYIGVIRVMFAGEAADTSLIKIPVSLKLGMAVSIAMTLLLGIFPGPATEWTLNVANLFMK